MMYDIESYFKDLEAFLKANLNTQIAAMNTEKSDSIVLATVNDAAYYWQYPGDRYQSYSPFVVYEETDVALAAGAAGPNLAYTHGIGVSLVMNDNADDVNIIARMFRYRRVLMDLLRLNWDRIGKSQIAAMKGFAPTQPFQYITQDWTGRAVGATMKITLLT